MLSFVVRAGGGSVRDSLSVLDQLIAGSGPEGLTYDSAAALLGFTDGELLDAAIDAFGAADGAGAFRAIEKVIESGLDPRRFVEDLLERLRDLIIVSAVPDGASAVLRALPEDQLDRMRHQAAAFGAGALSRAADIVNAGLTEMTGATAPRLQLELIAARVLLPGAAGEAGYAARLDRLERRLDVGGVPSPSARGSSCAHPRRRDPRRAPHRPRRRARAAGRGRARSRPARRVRSRPRPAPAGAPEPGPPGRPCPRGRTRAEPLPAVGRPAAGIDTAAIRRSWPDVLAKVFELRRGTWTFLSEHAQVLDYDGRRILLGIATVGLTNTFRSGVHAEIVRQAFIDTLGLDVRVEGVVVEPGGGGRPAPAPDVDPPTAAPSRPRAAEATAPPRRDPAPDPDEWSSPGPQSGAPPAWATAGPAPAAGPAPRPAEPGQPATPARRRFEPEPEPEPHEVDDEAVSLDDEDIAELGEVGVPVVERILGATVIDDEAP